MPQKQMSPRPEAGVAPLHQIGLRGFIEIDNHVPAEDNIQGLHKPGQIGFQILVPKGDQFLNFRLGWFVSGPLDKLVIQVDFGNRERFGILIDSRAGDFQHPLADIGSQDLNLPGAEELRCSRACIAIV